jgi:hypothetical protein
MKFVFSENDGNDMNSMTCDDICVTFEVVPLLYSNVYIDL